MPARGVTSSKLTVGARTCLLCSKITFRCQTALIPANHSLTFCHVPFTSHPIARGALRRYWRRHLYGAGAFKLCGALPDAKGCLVHLDGTGSAGIKTSILDEPGLRMAGILIILVNAWYSLTAACRLQHCLDLIAPPPSHPTFSHTHIFAHRSNIDLSSCPLAVWVYLSNSLESEHTPRPGDLWRKLRVRPVYIPLTQTHAVQAHHSSPQSDLASSPELPGTNLHTSDMKEKHQSACREVSLRVLYRWCLGYQSIRDKTGEGARRLTIFMSAIIQRIYLCHESECRLATSTPVCICTPVLPRVTLKIDQVVSRGRSF